MSSIWRANLRLTEWAFVFAFPSDRLSFERFHAWSEFCSQFNNWEDYRTKVIDAFDELIIPMEHHGLLIYRHASIRDFRIAFRKRRAVVLFSHHNIFSIEFRGGMLPFERVLKGMPRGFEGILELSVCSPTADMISCIRKRCPECGVAYMPVDLTPNDWIIYFSQLLLQFYDTESSYMGAEASVRQLRAKR